MSHSYQSVGLSTSIDVPTGQVWWFDPWRPKEFVRPCNHDCPGATLEVIAWGSTLLEYELLECSKCLCRAWRSAAGTYYKSWWAVERTVE